VENNKPFLSPDLVKIKDKYFHFLVEVRKKLIFTGIVFLIATFAGFVFYEKIIKFLVSLLSLSGVNIVFTSPFQFINLSISCGVTVGLIVIFPILIAQILSFLKPALKRKEFKMVTKFLPFCLILFLIGFFFGAFVMKWQIEIFLTRASALGIGNMLDISRLLSTILLTSTLMGVSFQFPIVLILLMRLKIVNHKQLSKKRLWIYLGTFILVLFLPADSIITDVLLSLPLILLFELALLIGYVYEKKKSKNN
jgi:sec-independent protein translocase protein TatC